MNARNLLFERWLLELFMCGQKDGEKGVAGEKGTERSVKCREGSEDKRKIARNSRALVAVAGCKTNIHNHTICLGNNHMGNNHTVLNVAIYPLSLFVFAKNASNTFSDRVFKHPQYVAI